MYATAQDIVDRYGKDLLVLLTDIDSDADCASGECDTVAVLRAASDADAEIDMYLGARYNLPLPVVPDPLKRLAVDIMVYRLAATADVATEEQRKRYEDVIKVLAQFAKGLVSLGLPVTQTPTSSNGAVFVAGPQRLFGRGKRV